MSARLLCSLRDEQQPKWQKVSAPLRSPLLEFRRLLQELQPRMAQQHPRKQRPQVLRRNVQRVLLQRR